MCNNGSRKRIGLFAAGGLVMVSAFLFWIADIGAVFALCLAAFGFCLFAAGLSAQDEKCE